MLKRIDQYRSLTAIIVFASAVTLVALPGGAAGFVNNPIPADEVFGTDGSTTKGTLLVTEIMMVDPALATSHPNLAGGVTDTGTPGVDGNDPRFVDNVEILTFGNTPRPGYFPSCPSCPGQRAVEFGGPSPFYPVGTAAVFYANNAGTELIQQMASIDNGLVDGMGRLTGFNYFEQHDPVQKIDGGLPSSGFVSGQVVFMDNDGDGDMDVWRVIHAGDSIGSYGPPPFTLDVDVVTADLNSDGDDDVVSFNDFFNVWDGLTGNSSDLAGQVWLPLVDDPSEPGMRSLVFNDVAMDSATVVGGPLPRTAPLAGGAGVPPGPAIPTIGSWGVALLLGAMAALGWNILRRGGFASA